MVGYFWNGRRIEQSIAKARMMAKVASEGGCFDEAEAIWNKRLDSEEARDTIFTLSGYCLEIELDSEE